MTNVENTSDNYWFHRCGVCEHCFSAPELASDCPKCGDHENRDTISHNFYLNERYGTMTPEEWSTAIGIEDLINPVDTPGDTYASDPDGET